MSRITKVIQRYKRDGTGEATRYYFRVLKNMLFHFPEEKALPLIIRLEKKLPINNYIVFECENDMDDNPRAVYEYLLKTGWNNRHKLIWIVRDVNTCKALYANKNVIFLSRFDRSNKNQVQLEYYLSTAKWFIFSHPYWFQKRRKKQIIININHGTPFKKRSAHDSPHIGESFDYLLSSSKSLIELNMQAWCCDLSKVFVCGFPRIDFFTEGKKDDVFSPLFLWHHNERVIICMPTYKQSINRIDSHKIDPYSLDVVRTEKELIDLNQYLKDTDTHLLILPHPLQVLDNLYPKNLSNIHYTSNKELFQKQIIVYKLIGCCDGLITDCSSVFFDFMLLKRPMAFLMNNVREYDRGLIYEKPEQYMPGEKIYNYNDLIQFIHDTSSGIDPYYEERERVNILINGRDQSQNSKKFLEKMFEL